MPTEKFVSDLRLVRDVKYCLYDLRESIVMYPEASYSFDGTALTSAFTFDHFKEQHQAQLVVNEPFRADGLHRALYKCPSCEAEGHMEGAGVHLTCHACGKAYELTETGKLAAVEGPTEHEFVSDWYAWQRACVAQELREGRYRYRQPVDIYVLVDTTCVYRVGEGVLTHSDQGFHLQGCDGQLDYRQKPQASYRLYADYFWYEIGDMVAIGTAKCRYYCFPKDQEHAQVAKVRLAAEELFKQV